LYNFYAVNTGKLCPVGWHVPTDDELNALVTILGGMSLAGHELREAGTVHWTGPNTGATNSSGFTSLGAGYRDAGSGGFIGQGAYAIFWSSSLSDPTHAWYWFWGTGDPNISRYNIGGYFDSVRAYGLSIRCLQN
jgi:uncharacterized protein (TIGR02145 family)